MSPWAWAAASSRGTSHERAGTRLQDAHSCFVAASTRDNIFVAVIADGAGSAQMGGQGASLVCRAIGVCIRRHFRSTPTLPTDEQIEAWIDEARDRIYSVAQSRGLVPRDFAATLICAVTDGDELVVAHIGDRCLVLHDAAT